MAIVRRTPMLSKRKSSGRSRSLSTDLFGSARHLDNVCAHSYRELTDQTISARRRVGRVWVDNAVGNYETGACEIPNADCVRLSRWADPQSKPRARGTVFASNVEVAEYFRLVHGFTRSAWLEELARYEEAKAQQVTQGQYFVQRYGYAHAPNAEESMKFRAKSAFVSYCQRTTNVSEQTKPSTARDTSLTNR